MVGKLDSGSSPGSSIGQFLTGLTQLLEVLENSWNYRIFHRGPGHFLESSLFSTYSGKLPEFQCDIKNKNVVIYLNSTNKW